MNKRGFLLVFYNYLKRISINKMTKCSYQSCCLKFFLRNFPDENKIEENKWIRCDVLCSTHFLLFHFDNKNVKGAEGSPSITIKSHYYSNKWNVILIIRKYCVGGGVNPFNQLVLVWNCQINISEPNAGPLKILIIRLK